MFLLFYWSWSQLIVENAMVTWWCWGWPLQCWPRAWGPPPQWTPPCPWVPLFQTLNEDVSTLIYVTITIRYTLIKSEIQNSFMMSPMSLRNLITYITHILSYLSVLCNQPTTNMFRTFGTSNCQAQIVKYKHCDPLKLMYSTRYKGACRLSDIFHKKAIYFTDKSVVWH